MNKKSQGFTLLELIVTIAIIGILAAIAAPSFSRMMARNQLQTAVGEWQTAFYLAQKEAIRRKTRVQICPSTNGETCASDSQNYKVGWIVRDMDANANNLIRDFPPTLKGNDEKITLNFNAGSGVSLIFLNNGRLTGTGNFVGANFTAENERFDNLQIKLCISSAGRIRNVEQNSDCN